MKYKELPYEVRCAVETYNINNELAVDCLEQALTIAKDHEAPIKYHDVKLKAKLRRPDVLAAVLSWAVEGCKLWQREGLEPIPEHIRDRLAAYYDEADDVGAFLAECCTLDKNARTPIGDLYDAFLKWYGPAKYPPMTKKSFSQALASRNFMREQGARGVRKIIGLSIRYY